MKLRFVAPPGLENSKRPLTPNWRPGLSFFARCAGLLSLCVLCAPCSQKVVAQTVGNIPAMGNISLVGTAPGIANAYSYRRSITIQSSQVPNTDQTDFPVLIAGTYSYLATTANGGNVTSPNGYDIIFTSDQSGLSPLNHEIDSYNSATGAVAFWVSVPTVSHTSGTVIYMFYGNSGVTTSQEHAASVWSAANYAAVYHFGNGTALSLADSTGNANTLTNNNGATAAAGAIGGGVQFVSASSQSLSITSPIGLPTTDARSLELLFKQNLGSTQSGMFGGWGNDAASGGAFDCQLPYISGRYINCDTGGQSEYAAYTVDSNWHWLAATAPANATTLSLQLYVDGVLRSTTLGGTAATLDTAGELAVGRQTGANQNIWWNGWIDEFRIATVQHSADWISTEKNNYLSPGSFSTISPPF